MDIQIFVIGIITIILVEIIFVIFLQLSYLKKDLLSMKTGKNKWQFVDIWCGFVLIYNKWFNFY